MLQIPYPTLPENSDENICNNFSIFLLMYCEKYFQNVETFIDLLKPESIHKTENTSATIIRSK